MMCKRCNKVWTFENNHCMWCTAAEDDIKSRGYTKTVIVTGIFGCSELAMYCKISELKGHYALIQPDKEFLQGLSHYAYVLCENGQWYDGILNVFEDQTFSLA